MIEIKPAGIENVGTIQQLAHKIWPIAYGSILSSEQLEYMLDKFYSVTSLQRQISISHHQFILALENKEPIGYASFSAHDDNGAIYHLNKIYVLPQQQKKDIGNKLLSYVIEKIKSVGGHTLQLNVNRNNKALHFYENQGFKIIREEDIDIGNGFFMNDYVMEKPLTHFQKDPGR